MLTTAKHSASALTPIEKTFAKIFGPIDHTAPGVMDQKRYSGSREFEFSKSWRGLKVKLPPKQGETLDASRLSKRKAGEAAITAKVSESVRPLHLDGTALIQAIKGERRLNVGHVLDCIRWLEFARRNEETGPQASALMAFVAQQGLHAETIDTNTFKAAAGAMRATPTLTAQSAWTQATAPTDAMFSSPARESQHIAVAAEPRERKGEGKREESPTDDEVVVHMSPSRGAPMSSSASPAVLAGSQPALPATHASPSVEAIADELKNAKGGERLSPETAHELAQLVLKQAALHDMPVEEMVSHAKAVVLEKRMAVGTTMFKELAHVTPLRQPLRDFLAR